MLSVSIGVICGLRWDQHPASRTSPRLAEKVAYGLLGIGMLIFSLALIRQGQAPRWATISFGFGMLTGIAIFFLLDLLKVGSIDSYGDYPVASNIGAAVMLTTSALGSIGVGRWLKTR